MSQEMLSRAMSYLAEDLIAECHAAPAVSGRTVLLRRVRNVGLIAACLCLCVLASLPLSRLAMGKTACDAAAKDTAESLYGDSLFFQSTGSAVQHGNGDKDVSFFTKDECDGVPSEDVNMFGPIATSPAGSPPALTLREDGTLAVTLTLDADTAARLSVRLSENADDPTITLTSGSTKASYASSVKTDQSQVTRLYLENESGVRFDSFPGTPGLYTLVIVVIPTTDEALPDKILVEPFGYLPVVRP